VAGLHSRPDHRHWRGALFALLASLLFSTQDALIKWLSDNYTLLQLLLIRSALSVPLMFLAVRARYGWQGLTTTKPAAHQRVLSRPPQEDATCEIDRHRCVSRNEICHKIVEILETARRRNIYHEYE
jgi:hypothetical protein